MNSKDSRPIRVLIVEDHEIFRYALGRTLAADPSFSVIGSAGTVAAATAFVADQRPDIVLMDYQLPDGNGVDATRSILEVAPETRVVILTMHADENLAHEALAAGASGYVVKSGTFEELVLSIRAANTGGTMISPVLTSALLRKETTHDALTPRELETLQLLANGLTTREVAAALNLSVNTVRNHVQNILTKLNAHSRIEAINIGRQRHILRSSVSESVSPRRRRST